MVADQTIIAENGNTVEQNCCLVKYPHSVCYADLTLKSNTTLCNDLIPDYTLVEGVDFLTCTGGCTQNDCAMF
ncbi:MAG: hypothetical protein DHS20C13_30040 [Thermodesulfobacteriota bacterium]|nr:MAG: hypothetical protein DHS20C13_30040 [Thermodesulfobacteriota bacterium]